MYASKRFQVLVYNERSAEVCAYNETSRVQLVHYTGEGAVKRAELFCDKLENDCTLAQFHNHDRR